MSKEYERIRRELQAEADAIAQALVDDERADRAREKAEDAKELALLKQANASLDKLLAEEKAERAREKVEAAELRRLFDAMTAKIIAAIPVEKENEKQEMVDYTKAIDAMGNRIIAAFQAMERAEVEAPEYVLDVTSKFADGRIKSITAKPKGK